MGYFKNLFMYDFDFVSKDNLININALQITGLCVGVQFVLLSAGTWWTWLKNIWYQSSS